MSKSKGTIILEFLEKWAVPFLVVLTGFALYTMWGISDKLGSLNSTTQHLGTDVATVKQDVAAARKDISDLSQRVARLEAIVEQHGKGIDRIERGLLRLEKSRTTTFEVDLTAKDVTKEKEFSKDRIVFEKALPFTIEKDKLPFARATVRPHLSSLDEMLPGGWSASAIVTDKGRLQITITTSRADMIHKLLAKNGMKIPVDVTLTVPE